AALGVGGQEGTLGHDAIEEILPGPVADRSVGVDEGADGAQVRFEAPPHQISIGNGWRRRRRKPIDGPDHVHGRQLVLIDRGCHHVSTYLDGLTLSSAARHADHMESLDNYPPLTAPATGGSQPAALPPPVGRATWDRSR